ncbi:TPA: hypothetical protein ACKQCJ_004212 [Stenotrophomonas maltophilia]|jgi:hypothetical protein|uniref:Uncharacterized protein n=1 Tax=Stenotrophomonas maltophilia TaxID=40324 RepID=A0AAI9G3Z6_STEMA|nr:hypothetical protein [Stenotrophomonas maltophilia]EKU9965811.1 hypothetical protein [Stenotrophomonas maltophilia]EKZ1926532.1 hypothetical protein [Stenotrophomonas maltophilia]ELE7124583.1 hypothetical protein [Stenotrophomonas maltophilia]EMB2747222.1 hypothetical protein [Stenotrophomonas maltophilia]MBH1377173.1 hypothetical protein [Stenotrophomonas maltophilia]
MTTTSLTNGKPQLTVRDVQAILADCDPDAAIELNLPAFFDENDRTVAADSDPLGMSFGYVPAVEVGFQTSKDVPYESLFDARGEARPGVKPNAVSIGLRKEDANTILANRKQAIEDGDADAGKEAEPVAGDVDTVIVDIAIPRSLHATIRKLLLSVNTSPQVREERACTHGPLTVAGLLAMLAEDVGMVETRPGCWEASNMAQVLAGHGYNY